MLLVAIPLGHDAKAGTGSSWILSPLLSSFPRERGALVPPSEQLEVYIILRRESSSTEHGSISLRSR